MSHLRTAVLATASALALCSSPALADQTAQTTVSNPQEIVVTGRPSIGDFGVDLTARDLTVKPGDDFEKYASGSWIKATEIPADRPSTGSFYNLREDVVKNVNGLITGSKTTKFGRLYATYMDEKAIERAGLAPLMPQIATVRAIDNKADFARDMGSTIRTFGSTLVGAFVVPDTDNPEINGLFLGQGGMGLPQKDYYFKPDYAKQRGAYLDYITRTIAALGHKDARAKASEVMAFETELASVAWDAADQRDISKINNPMSSADLAAYAPGMDWDALFAGAGIPPQERMIVTDNTAIKATAALYSVKPLETLKLWQEFHVADQACAAILPKKFVDSKFAFTSTLSGVTAQRDRWKRAVDVVDGSLGELVGEAYVGGILPAGRQGADGGPREEREGGDGRPHPGERVDGRGDQARRAREAGEDATSWSATPTSGATIRS